MLTNFDSKQYRPRYFLVKLVNIKKIYDKKHFRVSAGKEQMKIRLSQDFCRW